MRIASTGDETTTCSARHVVRGAVSRLCGFRLSLASMAPIQITRSHTKTEGSAVKPRGFEKFVRQVLAHFVVRPPTASPSARHPITLLRLAQAHSDTACSLLLCSLSSLGPRSSLTRCYPLCAAFSARNARRYIRCFQVDAGAPPRPLEHGRLQDRLLLAAWARIPGARSRFTVGHPEIMRFHQEREHHQRQKARSAWHDCERQARWHGYR